MLEKLIIKIDSSGIKELVCPLRYYRTVVQGFKPKQTNPSMAFGLAFHVFRKLFREKGGDDGFGEAVFAANKYYKSLNIAVSEKKAYLNSTYLINTCNAYAELYAKDNVKPVSDPKPLLELQFPFPYRVTDTYEVIILGTIDEIAKISHGIYVIVDCKTSEKSDEQIKPYLDSYSISRQLMMYVYLVKNFSKLFPGTIFDEIASSQVGAMIDGVFPQGKDKLQFKRSDVFLFKEELWNEFLVLLDRFVERAIAIHMNPEKRPLKEGIFTDACSLYGGCPYFIPCSACDERTSDLLLERAFDRKPYDPLHYND